MYVCMINGYSLILYNINSTYTRTKKKFLGLFNIKHSLNSEIKCDIEVAHKFLHYDRFGKFLLPYPLWCINWMLGIFIFIFLFFVYPRRVKCWMSFFFLFVCFWRKYFPHVSNNTYTRRARWGRIWGRNECIKFHKQR